MKSLGDSWLTLIFLAIFAAATVGIVVGIKSYACPARWKDSGAKAEYRVMAGCMVQRKDGSWLPEKVLRSVSQ